MGTKAFPFQAHLGLFYRAVGWDLLAHYMGAPNVQPENHWYILDSKCCQSPGPPVPLHYPK